MLHEPIIAGDLDPLSPAEFRQRLLIETGRGYAEFRRMLTPDFRRVKTDLALGYAALAGVLALAGLAEGAIAGLAAACAGAVGVGFLVAFLQLFIHEAAHFNLAATRASNDRLADRLIAWQVGTSIAAYRRTHAEHHRHLGDARDAETSYRHALTPRFMAEMLVGLHAWRVFRARRADGGPAGSRWPLLCGLAVHALFLGAMLALGAWPAALAWCGGVGVVYPFLATVRQMLEHRPAPGERGEGDAVTRLFDDGPFARIFGGAGFNRHLLHHLEPQVSYTRLGELEAYLMHSSVGPVLDKYRATYPAVFARLVRETQHG